MPSLSARLITRTKWRPGRTGEGVSSGLTTPSDVHPLTVDAVLDFIAPGVNIESCGISNENAKATLSGTSMGKLGCSVLWHFCCVIMELFDLTFTAAPHVAGLACCLRQRDGYADPVAVAYVLRERAEGAISGFDQKPGTPNIASVNMPVNEQFWP